MSKKFYKGKNDAMFKAIFCKEENRDLLKQLIEETTNMKVEIVEVKVPEILKKNIYEKGKTLDVLVKADNQLINIEVNSYSDIELRRRNCAYIFEKYSELTKVGNSYLSMPQVIQINLTSTSDIKIPIKSKYEIYDKNNKLKYVDNLIIYEFNIEKIRKECYNKDDEYKLLKLLDCDEEELKQIKGDTYMEKYKKEVFNLNMDEEFVRFMSDEDEARLLRNTFIEKGFEQGIEEGIKEGKKQGLEEGKKDGIKEGSNQKAKEIAIEMLKNNESIDKIMLYTNLTEEEISELNK